MTIARAHSSLTFPSNFMLVAAMNPTPKGDKPSDDFSQKQMERYLSKLSGPMIDRIDIHVDVPRIPFEQLKEKGTGTSTAEIRERVSRARKIQLSRAGNRKKNNADLSNKDLDTTAKLCSVGEEILKSAMTELNLSARAYDKIRRVSRTIADVEGCEEIKAEHVAEAVGYRLLDRIL